MAKSFIKTRIRLPKVPSVPEKYSAKLILPTARGEEFSAAQAGLCGLLCALPQRAERGSSATQHIQSGELSLPHVGFASPELRVLPTSLAPFLWAPPGIPWTTQMPSRPPRGAGSNPTLSQLLVWALRLRPHLDTP